MTTYFVTRHQGAKDWAQQQGIVVDQLTEHIDPVNIQPGDVVIGTLPVHLAAQVQENGGRYLHLQLDLPPALRGKELSAEEMSRVNAQLSEYRISQISNTDKEK